MKNKKSPIKFLGAIGSAIGLGSTAGLAGLLGRGGGNQGYDAGAGRNALDQGYQGIGGRIGGMVPGTQFNPEAIQAANGIFGNVNARQASLGASGLYALEKHLSPKTKKPNLTAYKPPNPPFDPTSGDDGAGGTEYDTN